MEYIQAKYQYSIMKYVLVFCSILMTSYMHGQSPLSLDYLSVEEIDKKEITLESEFIDTIEFELSLDNFSSSTYTRTKVLIYKRTKDDFSPKLHVWYHLDPLSNKLLAITYLIKDQDDTIQISNG